MVRFWIVETPKKNKNKTVAHTININYTQDHHQQENKKKTKHNKKIKITTTKYVYSNIKQADNKKDITNIQENQSSCKNLKGTYYYNIFIVGASVFKY